MAAFADLFRHCQGCWTYTGALRSATGAATVPQKTNNEFDDLTLNHSATIGNGCRNPPKADRKCGNKRTTNEENFKY